MTVRVLPVEIVAMVHHLELNRAGWWDRALNRLVLAGFWLVGPTATLRDVRTFLKRNFGLAINLNRAEQHVEALVASGDLQPLHRDRYKISEATSARLLRERNESEQLAQSAKAVFSELLHELCPSLDGAATWQAFHDQMLAPVVQELGASVHRLLTGEIPKLPAARVRSFVAQYPSEEQANLQQVTIRFLDPSSPTVRQYMLGLLNSYFCVEAASLGKKTIDALSAAQSREASFQIFADTNFLFSLLRLHDNPSNEAAVSLQELVQELGPNVDVRMLALDVTIDEARSVMRRTSEYLDTISWRRNLAVAVAGTSFSGLATKFVEAAARSRSDLTAAGYFGPYLDNLATILGTKGITIHHEGASSYLTSRETERDVRHQVDYERRTYPRPKTEGELRHDVALWHFVHDHREPGLESPLDAKYWIVTEDYRFIRYARNKATRLGEMLVLCLHPATLMQLLEFWIPRTPEFERAMLSSIRLPFLFKEFDAATERVTLRILKTLSQFENADDLSPELVASIVRNDVLRSRIDSDRQRSDPEQDRAHVREALVEEVRSREEALDIAVRRSESLDEAIRGRDVALADLSARTTEQGVELARERSAREQAQLELEQLRRMVDVEKLERQDRRRFWIRWFLVPAVASGLMVASVTAVSAEMVRAEPYYLAGLLSGAALALWVFAAGVGHRSQTVERAQLFIRFRAARRILLAALAALFLAVLGNALWELSPLKPFLSGIFGPKPTLLPAPVGQ